MKLTLNPSIKANPCETSNTALLWREFHVWDVADGCTTIMFKIAHEFHFCRVQSLQSHFGHLHARRADEQNGKL